MGARMVPANGQTTKTQKIFYMSFGWKGFPSYYKYIHSRAIFVLEKGVCGACFYWLVCFYCDIYIRYVQQGKTMDNKSYIYMKNINILG